MREHLAELVEATRDVHCHANRNSPNSYRLATRDRPESTLFHRSGLVLDQRRQVVSDPTQCASELCEPCYARHGRPSIPPGVYFRMLFIGYFEGIDSQRGIAWR